MKGNDDLVCTLASWVRNAALMMIIILSCAWFLCGCSRWTQNVPVESREVSLRADSVTKFLMRLLDEQKTVRESDSFSRVERVMEKTVVNERGDTMRHDTHTEVSTAYVATLESNIRQLRIENDSLRRTSARVDSIPVPYEVRVPYPLGKDLTAWEKARLHSWPWLLAALAAAVVYVFRVPIRGWIRRVVTR